MKTQISNGETQQLKMKYVIFIEELQDISQSIRNKKRECNL